MNNLKELLSCSSCGHSFAMDDLGKVCKVEDVDYDDVTHSFIHKLSCGHIVQGEYPNFCSICGAKVIGG